MVERSVPVEMITDFILHASVFATILRLSRINVNTPAVDYSAYKILSIIFESSRYLQIFVIVALS